MAEVARRIRDTPYPRLHALLDVVGIRDVENGAPADDTSIDEAGDWRFSMPGPDSTELSLRLDEIELPEHTLSPRFPSTADLAAIMDDVGARARAVTVATKTWSQNSIFMSLRMLMTVQASVSSGSVVRSVRS